MIYCRVYANGTDMGVYGGSGEPRVMDAYAADAGYEDYADLVAQVPDASPDDVELEWLEGDELARHVAEEIAEMQGWTLGEQRYSYEDTGQAAAWHIDGMPGYRLAVNVERPTDPRPVLEYGPLDDPDYKASWTYTDSLGWMLSDQTDPDAPV